MQYQEIVSVQLQLASSIQKENGIQWIGSTKCTHTVVLFQNLYFYDTLIVIKDVNIVHRGVR